MTWWPAPSCVACSFPMARGRALPREETAVIRFVCPKCQKKLKAPDTAVGKRVSCPECRSSVEIPPSSATPARIDFACPSCRHQFHAPLNCAGRKIACRQCGQKVRVPLPLNARSKTVEGELIPPPSAWARAPKVFISHSTKDRAFVEREIIALLKSQGIDAWYSKVKIRTAKEWDRTIMKGLESCEWFLIAMSPNSATSEWVRDEVHWAFDERPGKIIPVLIKACKPRDFHLRMARLQYVDLSGPDLAEGRTQLLDALSGKPPVDEESSDPRTAITGGPVALSDYLAGKPFLQTPWRRSKMPAWSGSGISG